MASNFSRDNLNGGDLQFTLGQFCKMAAVSYKRQFLNPSLQPLFWCFMADLSLEMSKRMWRNQKTYKQEDILAKMQQLFKQELGEGNGN